LEEDAMSRGFLYVLTVCLLVGSLTACSAPLSTREKGGLVGAGAGAGVGAIIGSTVGHAAVGAAIGGPVGLIAGALIGDQLMGQEQRQNDQQRTIDTNQAEIERLRRENERLKQQRGEW
jgi:outer membrane lipoprotein SlyB